MIRITNDPQQRCRRRKRPMTPPKAFDVRTFPPGTPVEVVLAGKGLMRGLLRGVDGADCVLVDMGDGAESIPEEFVFPTKCVGAKVIVEGIESMSLSYVNGLKGVIRRHRRGTEEAYLVRFEAGSARFSCWIKPANLRLVAPGPPRHSIGPGPCASAGEKDWGMGLASCERCGRWPVLNRGCDLCLRKMCTTCRQEHAADSSDGDEAEFDELQIAPPDYHDPLVQPADGCLVRDAKASDSCSSGSESRRRVDFTLPGDIIDGTQHAKSDRPTFASRLVEEEGEDGWVEVTTKPTSSPPND